jgi:adenine phosphoribosyltransferase
MNWNLYKKLIKKGSPRCDPTPIFDDKVLFQKLIGDLIKPFKNRKITKVVALDALGFIIGGAIAYKLKVGFIPIRKGGKLPQNKKFIRKVSFVDYTKTKKTFEINKGLIKKSDKILLVDEWIHTGSQIKAAIRLIEEEGGNIIGISTIYANRLNKNEMLFKKYNCHAIREVKKNS